MAKEDEVKLEHTIGTDSAITRFIFQGQDPKTYLKAASKLLIAGALGVATGWVLQPFFSTVFGWPYWLSYWPAVFIGFIVNLRSQVRMKNLNVEKRPD